MPTTETETKTESRKAFVVVRNAGRPTERFHTHKPEIWTKDKSRALYHAEQDDAQAQADDFNDYWAVKGCGDFATVKRIEWRADA